MKKIFFSLAALLSSFAVADAATPQPLPRHLDPAVVAIGKELPRSEVVSHDSRSEAILGERDASRYLQPLTVWAKTETTEATSFKTNYKIPFEWIDREQFLYMGSVTASFDVVINGELAGYSQTGSTPSEFDITGASKEGVNELEIVVYKDPVARKLENSREPVPPQIDGEAYILSQPKMRVRDIVVSTGMEGTNGLLELGIIMKSHNLNPKDYTVYYELLSPRGEIVAEGYKDATLNMRREDTVRFFANIPRIVPWSHEEPCLYTLLVKTRNEGRYREYLSFRVGFRGLDMRDGVLHLNSTPLPVRMQEFTPSRDTSEMRRQIGALQARGINALRLRGVPPSGEFRTLCDEMGIYVCPEADLDTHLSGPSRKIGGNPSNDPVWEGSFLDRTLAMYHTGRNNASTVAFSLAGEGSANGYNLYESYLALKAAERRRPVVYFGGGEWNTDRFDTEATSVIPGTPDGEHKVFITAETAETAGRTVGEAKFRIDNNRLLTPLTGEAVYSVVVGRKTVSSGILRLALPAGESVRFDVPVAGVPKKTKSYTVVIEVRTENNTGRYIPSGDEGEQKMFRDPEAALTEADSIVVERREFTFER